MVMLGVFEGVCAELGVVLKVLLWDGVRVGVWLRVVVCVAVVLAEAASVNVAVLLADTLGDGMGNQNTS